MLKGLGLHAEQLEVWALRATEGNLLEDNSKAIGDEVSVSDVTAASTWRVVQAAAGQPLQLPADMGAAWQRPLQSGRQSGAADRACHCWAVASQHQGSTQAMILVADSLGAAEWGARLLCIEAGRLKGSEAQTLHPQTLGRHTDWLSRCPSCQDVHPCAVQVFSKTVWLSPGSSTERRGVACHICLPSSPACRWLSIPESSRPALSSCLLMMLIPCWTGRVRMPQRMPINGFHGHSLPIL